jgi:mannose-6-phosphate isomerase-like protein (cupin superfamily)
LDGTIQSAKTFRPSISDPEGSNDHNGERVRGWSEGQQAVGNWEVLDVGEGYAVKRVRVSPGRRLSLQTHAHRAEHWVVVSGTARVTVGKRVLDLTPGQSIDIAIGERHRIENTGPAS